MADQITAPPHKSILQQGEEQITNAIAPLGDDDKAAIIATAESTAHGNRGRVAGAVDIGKGWSAGGHVEKTEGQKVGWFAGFRKRWKKK